MAKDIELPRMARIEWPDRLGNHVYLSKERLVLNQSTAEALIDAMVEEAFWRSPEEKKKSLT